MSTDLTIVVTGANSGIGFGFCHRILVQLSFSSVPPDALLSAPKNNPPASPYAPCAGLTLILACRNIDNANKARTRLLSLLEAHITRLSKNKYEYIEHAKKFQKNVKIETHVLDLSSTSSTLAFAHWVIQSHSHVSHLICNAAVAPFSHINRLAAVKQLMLHPSKAMILPEYLCERTGEKSADGLGLVWQTNVFGHYILCRMFSDLFINYTNKSGIRPRVIWVSSSSASGKHYDPDDWQLIKHARPYGASKYENEIIAAFLSSTVLSPHIDDAGAAFKSPSWHLIVQPGVVATTLDKLNSKGLLSVLRATTFVTVRCFGSKNHPSSSYKAAVSASHAALVSLPQESHAEGASNIDFNTWGPRRINSQAPMFRKEFVSSSEFNDGWNKVEAERAAGLIKNLDMMYSSLVRQGEGDAHA